MNPILFTNRFHNNNEPILPLNRRQLDALFQFKNKIANGHFSFEESPCLCGRYDGLLIAKRDRYGLPVDTYLCRSCGIMWTTPQMIEKSLKKFYEEDYRSIYVGKTIASESFFEDQIKRGKEIYNYVVDYPGLSPDSLLKVFDVGCGAGGVLLPFKDVGFLAYGCDLGSQYLEYGRDKGLLLEHGESNSLSKYGSANLIILNHVLEHFKFPLKSLEELRDLLVDDGYLYIELPGIFNIHNTYGDLLLFLQNAHLYHFTLETLTSVMSMAGFRFVKGDQTIRALYQKRNCISQTQSNKEFVVVVRYLYLFELLRKFQLLRIFTKFRKLILKIQAKIFRVFDNYKLPW